MRFTWIMMAAALGLLSGFGLGFWARTVMLMRRSRLVSAREKTRRQDAEREAKGIVREGEIQARSAVIKAREAFEASVKEQRREINETMSNLNARERAISQREDNLDRKAEVLDRKQEVIDRKTADAEAMQTAAKALSEEAGRARAQAEAKLQKLGGMTREDARKELFEQAKEDIRKDLSGFLIREKERVEKTAAKTAQQILLGAMERYAGSHVAEYMTRSVPVPNEEIKGRIIGREGRNIRAFEQVTGCSILVDDTPGMVVVSAADPLRRELGSLTLERLIASGRIQPQRIEELYELERQRFAQHLTDIGQQAATEADVNIASDEVLQTLGRLAYRLSYSQNVLRHSQEVAAYAGLLASELGLDPETARKVGLLHDIGKALDQTAQGPHALIGAEFLRKQGESEDVVEGVAGHHGEAQTHTVWAVLALCEPDRQARVACHGVSRRDARLRVSGGPRSAHSRGCGENERCRGASAGPFRGGENLAGRRDAGAGPRDSDSRDAVRGICALTRRTRAPAAPRPLRARRVRRFWSASSRWRSP